MATNTRIFSLYVVKNVESEKNKKEILYYFFIYFCENQTQII